MDELNEAINTYYKLKSQYEDSIKELKKKINIPGLSWKEKRRQFAKLTPKCIGCKRPVGTIFSNSLIDMDHHLIALCGDKLKPCPLKIDINKGITVNIRNFYMQDEKEIDELKIDVIKDKNNLLFGYNTSEEIVERFGKIREEVKSLTDDSAYLFEQYNNIVDNREKNEELRATQKELYANITAIKELMQGYDKTQNTQYVNDSVDLYINEILPRLKRVMQSKYLYHAVEIETDNKHKIPMVYLIQQLYTIVDLETNLGDSRIISMNGLP
jgi:hypothetical protein